MRRLMPVWLWLAARRQQCAWRLRLKRTPRQEQQHSGRLPWTARARTRKSALGAVLFFADWDWDTAERSLQRALQLSPNHSEALLLYGRYWRLWADSTRDFK